VDLLDRAGGGDLLAQPAPRPLPRLGPGHPLGAVLATGELSQLLELGDRTRRIERHERGLYNCHIGLTVQTALRRAALLPIALAVVLSQSSFLERGFIPYLVASQAIPLLAIAPMVVVGLGTKGVTDWIAVSVLAAYLTFFPVTINALRGLQSADPQAVELMRS